MRKWNNDLLRYEEELARGNALEADAKARDIRDTAPNLRDFSFTPEGHAAYDRAIEEWRNERWAAQIAREVEGWMRAGHSAEEAYALAVRYAA